MGFMRIKPKRARAAPPIIVTQTIMEKYSFAFSLSPSPKALATMAFPPVPITKPRAPSIEIKGRMILTAAKAVFPTKFDTNIPLYHAINGSKNHHNDRGKHKGKNSFICKMI